MALHSKVLDKKDRTPVVVYKAITFTPTNMSVVGRTVTGYLAAFNNIDSDLDRLKKGCFAKSLAERGVGTKNGNNIAHLWQHKMDTPLGNYTVLEEDDYGLRFECVYDDIQKANEALAQFKSGTLKNFSIGYSYVWDKMTWNEEDECFDITELNLYEGSVVTLAANAMAMYTGLKGQEIIDERKILKEEMEEILNTLKPRKRFELGQIFTKLIALSEAEPPLDTKEALRKAAEEKAAAEKLKLEAAKPKKGVKLDKLNELAVK